MQHATYVHLYTDEHGVSHLADVTLDLLPVSFAPPAEPQHVAQFLPAAQTIWVAMPPGWSGAEPHPTPQRQVFCILQGGCVVTASDGDTRQLGPGSVILLEDTWGQGHTTELTGEAGMLMLASRWRTQTTTAPILTNDPPDVKLYTVAQLCNIANGRCRNASTINFDAGSRPVFLLRVPDSGAGHRSTRWPGECPDRHA